MSWLLLLLACQCQQGFGEVTVTDAAAPFQPGACATQTTLQWSEPAPEEPRGTGNLDRLGFVPYPAQQGEMRAWIWGADRAEPAPTLVYFHSGFAWHNGLAEALRWLADDGWVVYMPAVRGENGNPGAYQLLCGEVDDAADAVRFIASQPYVDPNRIATFGHGAGGALSAMLALYPELPIAHSGSAGGLYFEKLLDGWGAMVPFDPSDRVEQRRRLFVSNLGSLVRPHEAWIGDEDALEAVVPAAEERARALGAPLTIHRVPGDHRTSLDPALRAFVEHTGW